ncbi:MAG: class I SAM-dependent methyltransferase [Acidimicrobiia bacterium]|nr:class I SAM-dependent methyltransferase [Acidimicrobiia bacterium]
MANLSPALSPLGDERFDFILSRLTLQHIEPDLSVQYIAALCRRLAPGGVLVFQLSSHPRPADTPQAPTVRAMPDQAYRATIAFQSIRDGTLTPGGRITLDLQIANLSALAWSQHEFGRMTVGNHWLDAASGRMLVRDDGRTGIPDRVRPGEVCLVPLSVTLPSQAGTYLCELDLSHEGLLWFEDKGSVTTRVAVTVSRDTVVVASPSDGPSATLSSSVDGPLADGEPWVPSPLGDRPEPFPMYGVPRETVLQVIARCGLDLIEVQDDHSCGDDWVSHQYYARHTRGDQRSSVRS